MYAHTQYHLRWMILVSSTVYKESLVAGMIVTQYAPCQILSQALQGCFWSCLWLTTTSPPTKQKRSVTKLHTMYTQWDWIFVDELTSLIFSKKGTPNTLWAAWRLERMRKRRIKGKDGTRQTKEERVGKKRENQAEEHVSSIQTYISLTFWKCATGIRASFSSSTNSSFRTSYPQERRTESSYTERIALL